ncbi:MAG TPA: 50S ribosomal protein L29 [Methanomicrobia archaeon]|nr:50S ribosomal protein L29 [Methanomicrobia archaeon]HEX59692.1 50S ribosomal protein L29 [Methanomicrobia archaeon]
MAILKMDEIRKMSDAELREELRELSMELLRERTKIAAGGALENPGRVREIRRTIARIKTVLEERRRAHGSL